MAPLTATEVVNHPAYKAVGYNLTPTVSGTHPVAHNRRGGPFNLYYEIHGTGPIKTVWIMGLNASHQDWRRQTRYFGHEHADKYSCLVFDNRGVGQSDKNVTFYSTSEMARDAVDLVASLGWIDLSAAPARAIHVIGASMGGMIAQELAMLIPDRLASLSLCCTAPRLVRTAPFMENLYQRASMFIPRHIDVELDQLAHSIFADAFLTQPDEEHEDARLNFPTKRDRFAASALKKREDTEGFTKKGFMLQIVACFFHQKTAKQLAELAERVGRERISLQHGTEDRMLTLKHGEILKEELGEGVVWKAYEGTGHMLGWERETELNGFLDEFIQTWS
ncbi:putative alpha/beta hydrolase [Aspergillus steynii IBT 23096]|uniref:Putative alpha/beta hydrolase n=1 Tax=Aspergillus steynii IBT 23096 TaxID=1392250 RepID=A0A2I2GGR2_9EURO|nr:putative alpha/beta hydrolase [Aspergillus steynii IBT 23096]PLB52075.1 putative alpha/beta hydrolase [Aspergillus steynii IBT 23096]